MCLYIYRLYVDMSFHFFLVRDPTIGPILIALREYTREGKSVDSGCKLVSSLVSSPTLQSWVHFLITGKTQRDRVEREVGGGIEMGNTCKSMANSCQCMTKTTTIL